MKGNEIPTPHREVSLQRAQLVLKKFCGLRLFQDVGQTESGFVFFGHSQNQLRLWRRAGTPSSLSKVIIYFHGAGPTSPRGCRGYNPQARVTLSRGVCVFLSRVLTVGVTQLCTLEPYTLGLKGNLLQKSGLKHKNILGLGFT